MSAKARAWAVVVLLVLAVLALNQARTTSCNNNRQDRFETAFRESAYWTALDMPELIAFDMGRKAADREHPTIWYCLGSDR